MSDIVPLFLQGRQTMSVGVDASDDAGRKIIGFPNPVNEKAARTVAGGVLLLCSVTLVLSLSAQRPMAMAHGADRTGVCRAGAHWSPAEPARPGGHQTGRAAPRHTQAGAWSAEAFCAGDWVGRDDCRRRRLGSWVSDGDPGHARSHDRGRGSRVDLRVLYRLPDLRRFDATRCDPSGDLRSMQQRLACAASASTNLDWLIRRSGCVQPAVRRAENNSVVRRPPGVRLRHWRTATALR